ncbi:MAG: hypothetical protein BRC32_06680 [Actinobacteria bacterium QS_8_72_14]|nr:MAG: hypothetical protein BRC32_06680 [Actinobacteria bacterium QS_8_72_14]
MEAATTPALGEVTVDLAAVILAVTEGSPRVLTVQGEADAEWAGEAGRRWVAERTGMQLGYVEQLYTFGDAGRDPRERAAGARVLSVAYLALVREQAFEAAGATWRDVYELLPWEDRRGGEPEVLAQAIEPALSRWWLAAGDEPTASTTTLDTAGGSPRERAEVAFGLGDLGWDSQRVLERYELLYEAGLVGEAGRDAGEPERGGHAQARLGKAMALDHRRILATALGRVRGKLSYRPVVFELLPEQFTLSALQRVVEALAGLRLHKQNFRRLVDRAGLVEPTGVQAHTARGRPAELFCFRREVLRERPAPGVGLPRSGR